MSKETKQTRLAQGLKLIATALLLISSNQTALFAGNSLHSFQQKLALSEQYTADISSQISNNPSSSKQYSVKIYDSETPKLISAMTRPLSGHISDILIEDINDDNQLEIVVMMEEDSAGKQYLMIDTFSFDGENMTWKQQLPSGFISVQNDIYLKRHEIPNNISRSTAAVLLEH